MSDHLSRKELKTDQAAVAVEHTVHYFAQHRQQVTRIAIGVVVVLLLIAGVTYFRNSQHAARELALGEALAVQSAQVGPSQPNGALAYPSEQAKTEAVNKAFNRVINDYSGSEEAYISEYYLAGLDVDAAKMDSAKKRYQDVADKAEKNYASLAKLALAQIYFAESKVADGEKIARDLVDHPTDLVSKEQATIALAKGIGPTRSAEARKLLEPIILKPEIGSVAMQAMNEIPAGK